VAVGAGLDASVGVGVESTYGTYATPTRWYEFLKESLDFEKKTVQGQGIRVGSRVARGARRVVATAKGKGDLELEVASKGLGLLFQAACGTSLSTLINGTSFQQLHTLGDLAGRSLTIQKGVPQLGGTVSPYTFLGCVVDSFELSAAEGDLLKSKFSFIAKDMTTAQSYVAPSYPAGMSLFHFAQGALVLGGSPTWPTATALATGGTTVANVSEFSLSVGNKLSAERYNLGGAGRMSNPVVGLRDVKGKLKAEFTDTVLAAAYAADSPLSLVLNFVSTNVISGANVETFQIAIPQIRLNGEIPKVDGTDIVEISTDFDGLDDLVNQPLYIAQVTGDAAL
jgi:hypothetical protein